MSLLILSNELLTLILSFDQILTRHDLYSSFMVCRRLNHVSQPLLYRSMKIFCNNLRQTFVHPFDEIVDLFNQHPERLPWVHNVIAAWHPQNHKATTSLFELLLKFPRLHSLEFWPAGPWDEDPPFQTLLNTCYMFTSLRILKIARIEVDHTFKLFEIPYLEKLVIRGLTVPPDWDVVPAQSSRPSRVKKLVIPMATCFPLGLYAELLCKCHPFVTTLVWTFDPAIPPPLQYPAAVLKALAPLQTSLVNLTFLINNDTRIYGVSQMDYSGFLGLKNLEIHEKLTFGRYFSSFIPGPPFHRGDIHDRLPKTLENLKIWFGKDSKALTYGPLGLPAYGWLMDFVPRKQSLLGNLTSVRLLEMSDWQYFKRPTAAAIEWNYPPDVEQSFRDARIHLEVKLRSDSLT
ncbi:hypothetical protein VTL71DRAFT_12881 [Oculimacula yallundae]|uniref:F-box domain-containing protein n=1 Tax=Oculimacula yallundae TaxID=86028 RepID=A0ABR4CQJ5_9HELO